MPMLSQLAIYPVKSTAQISLEKATMGPFGLDMDRRWMLIDNDGVMLTQRKHSRMCLINTSIADGKLNLNAAGMQGLSIDVMPQSSITITVKIWEDSCNAYDCGEAAEKWFSDFLNTPARLVYFPDHEIRQVDMKYARQGDITAFSDGFPYLLITQASLDDLNSRLKEPVEMSRFRPNLVISGVEAFAEDNWKKIRIGDITFKLVKPCSRCVIPSIDPKTAKKSAEPVRALANYRMRDNKILFGQNVIAEGSGELEVGMSVEIID